MRLIGMCKVVVVALLLVLGSAVRADDTAAARAAYRSASQHFKLGEYQPALDAFKEAYRLREDPSFLFNIGQCHRMLGQRTEAVAAFRAYLNDAKKAPNHADVEIVIAKLREEIAAENEKRRADAAAAAAAAAPVVVAPVAIVSEAPPPPPKKTPVYKKWWLWTAVGVVVVGVGVGLGVGLTRSAYPHASSTDGTFHF